jgi:putative transposase
MATPQKNTQGDYLQRLSPEFYQGQAYVHWSMTIEDRKTGWLSPRFYGQFREVLIHTMFRYGLCCPIYCCMPDHIHLLWIGIMDSSDQRNGARYFRKHLNVTLEQFGCRFQQQPYDHVLREEERDRSAFENVVEYIARNPERKHLVSPDSFQEYPYTGCLIPGYPELVLWHKGYWDRFWRTYDYLQHSGLVRSFDENP